jgi:hypothetical protein
MMSKSGIGTAITQVTNAIDHVTITIPAGKGGVLRYVELQTVTVDETVVDGGGLVNCKNSSADWSPFYLITPISGVVTLGGSAKLPIRYDVTKELPGNSTCTFDYYPYDNQSQSLEVTVGWEVGARLNKEEFMGYVYPLKAAAVTSTSRASPGTYAVPGGKGGRVTAFYDLPFPTLTTVVQSGGLLEVENDAFDMKPTQHYTVAHQAVGAGGDIMSIPFKTPWDCPCPQNSTFTLYYTPTNAESQTLAWLVKWERPVRRTVA